MMFSTGMCIYCVVETSDMEKTWEIPEEDQLQLTPADVKMNCKSNTIDDNLILSNTK